jgi:hypothetical protein
MRCLARRNIGATRSKNMKNHNLVIVLALASFATAPAFADGSSQTAQTVETQRDVNQQNRIEQGLESGQLSTREAGNLERQESHVDRMEAHAAADGTVSKGEAVRINSAQNAVSNNIYDQTHDAQLGHPSSASSTQMQAAVQRDANQEARINQGVKSGELTTHEAGKLEQGQAHVAHAEANAAANGRMSRAESAHVQRAENRQSHRIHRQKHDQQARNDARATGGA